MIAEGVVVVRRLLASFVPGARAARVPRRHAQLADDLTGTAAPFYVATAELMADVVGFHLNRGVLATADRVVFPSAADLLDSVRTVAVLEGVGDHENLGALFRNAAAFGVGAILLADGCSDPLYRRSVRVSRAHVLLVPYAWATSWPGDLELLRDNGFRLLAMTPEPSARPLPDAMTSLAGSGSRFWWAPKDLD